VKFAVIGDFGTGTTEQYELAKVMANVQSHAGFDIVLTVGDNIYGGWGTRAVAERFEVPYRPLLEAGVTFFASLGNHDSSQERIYPAFNMHGERYYSFTRGNVEFFALDSNYLDPPQVGWLRHALEMSAADWKVAFFHHPIYSSGGRHGSAEDLRAILEPLFLQFHVQLVFSGHDHVYERVKPQSGVTYFVCGSSGQLRRGNLDKRSPLTASGFDQDEAFLVAQIDGDLMRFSTIARTGAVVDSGEIER
jgi:3',5'-cyclic AMP phosphodiesterase CpdA